MIRTIQVEQHPNPFFFGPHPKAEQYCHGQGLEIGAAAHNPFGLDGALNVAPWHEDENHPWRRDFELYKAAQVQVCGSYAAIDIVGLADSIPVHDETQDYIVTSHVIEHIPSPVSAFLEWDRVLLPGGHIFTIYPKRGSLPQDRKYPVSTVDQIVAAYAMKKGQLETHQDHHPWRFTSQSMMDLILVTKEIFSLDWTIVYTEETDTKVGNGHTIVIRKDS